MTSSVSSSESPAVSMSFRMDLQVWASALPASALEDADSEADDSVAGLEAESEAGLEAESEAAPAALLSTDWDAEAEEESPLESPPEQAVRRRRGRRRPGRR